MGSWGDKLYQNDTAQDLKSEYRTYLKLGYTDLEVEEIVYDSFEEEILDGFDEIYWLVLADQEYKLGRLSKKVKKKALSYLKNPKTKELSDLKDRLNSPPLPRKKMGKLYAKRSEWKVGDILLYKIMEEHLIDIDKYKDCELIGKYVLFEVTYLARFNIGSLPRNEFYSEYPIVTLYDWIGDEIPSEEDISKMKLKNRKNLEAKTWLNYLPDMDYEKGMIVWKRKDFDTVQWILSFTKREIKKSGIVTLVPAKEPEEVLNSGEGRPFIHLRGFAEDIIWEFTD